MRTLILAALLASAASLAAASVVLPGGTVIIPGGTVIIPGGTVATSYSDPVGMAVMNENFTGTYDLSDLTGLTAGAPIKVTLGILAPSFVWEGAFNGDPLSPDEITLNISAQLELTAGGVTDGVIETQVVGPLPNLYDGVNPLVGYDERFGPIDLSVVVPWGTDLSAVEVSLTDISAIEGASSVFLDSAFVAGDITLTTISIPEPGTAVLGFLSTVSFLRRRR